MPRVTKPLSEKEIRHAKTKEKAYTLPDGQGLHLLVSPTGRKSWEFIFLSPKLHKRRKTSFGAYPNVTLAEARAKRSEWQELIKQNIDPIDEKREIKAQVERENESSFENVLALWLKDQKKRLKSNTYERKKSLFEKAVLPVFENRNMDDISHTEIKKVIDIKAIQTPATARKLYTFLNDLWAFAVDENLCKNNVVANIRKKNLPKVKRVHYSKIVDDGILKELIQKIYSYHGHYSTRNALKFVLHVPLRAQNLATLKWTYIDLEKATLTIPRELMKVTDENYDDFKLPLTPHVVEILNEQYLFTSHKEYVFTNDKGNHLNPESPNKALKIMGFNESGRKQRLHGFRGTFRSLADTHQAEHRCSYEAKEKVLDHTIGEMTERAYANKADYFQEMRILLEWWSGYILAMMNTK